MLKYTGAEVCPKCGGTSFGVTRHTPEDRCAISPEEHIHLTCGKCSYSLAVAPQDQPG